MAIEKSRKLIQIFESYDFDTLDKIPQDKVVIFVVSCFLSAILLLSRTTRLTRSSRHLVMHTIKSHTYIQMATYGEGGHIMIFFVLPDAVLTRRLGTF